MGVILFLWVVFDILILQIFRINNNDKDEEEF